MAAFLMPLSSASVLGLTFLIPSFGGKDREVENDQSAVGDC
jgi:hypothetical protein